MKQKKILVTGSSGFIGFHLCKSLLNDGFEVLGVDSMNNYYDVSLKQARLDRLKKYNNFNFNKIDISNYDLIASSFNNYRPNIVINLAAQAGVRYSIENPSIYIESNIVGFVNVIELCKKNKIDGLIYASSSSVYGGNTTIPFRESDSVRNPLALYGVTKRSNELIAHSYSHLFGLRTTGLRFFTVYGPWGRPDMAMFIFTKKILNGEPIHVYNNGNMKRDFTYIDDIISGTRSAMKKNYKYEIFNLGNNKSERLLDLISIIEQNLGKKAEIKFFPMQPGDVKESFADITHSYNKLDYNPKVKIIEGVPSFIKWYKKFINK